MGRINYSSINSKIKKCLDSSAKYKSYERLKANEICINLANEFQNTLFDEISSNDNLGYDGWLALKDTDISNFGIKANHVYKIDINFSGDMYRPSLLPDYYDGISDISALLNNGYEAKHSIFGYWEALNIHINSLTNREGAHFAQNATRAFSSIHNARKDGFKQIIINDKYR